MSDFRVIGRLVQSRQSGPLSYGTLLGIGDGLSLGSSKVVDLQYQTYESGGKFDSYKTYDSVIGFQGLLFSLFDEVTNFTPGYNLKIFRGFTSVLSAIALALITVWFFIEFGLLSALISLGFMLVSEWLTLYGGCIYWQLWAFYLPMIVATYYLAHPARKQASGIKTFVLLVLITVVIKCLFNESLKLLYGVLHHRPVTLTAHHNTDFDLGHRQFPQITRQEKTLDSIGSGLICEP